MVTETAYLPRTKPKGGRKIESFLETPAINDNDKILSVSERDVDLSHSRMLSKYETVYKKLAEYDSN